jgi:predicted GH43/DUF377 family glycosyl hydrolase
MDARKMLKRYRGNPILKPIKENSWESKRVFNSAAIYDAGKIHIIYRAQGEDNISRLGYACSSDGYHIDERLESPIFTPVGELEKSGCEDPRITRIDDRYYMCYTAFGQSAHALCKVENGPDLAQIGITHISVRDFMNRRWNWGRRIYPFPQVDNKDCVLFPNKFGGKYAIYHRIKPHIWVAYSDNLEDWSDSRHKIVVQTQETWECAKIGAGAPPIKTEKGWLLLYHGVDENHYYRLGLALIDKDNPEKVLKSKKPIFEPKEIYEQRIVFSCGAVMLDGNLFVYYGADDTVIGVATYNSSEVFSLFEE